MPEQKQVHRFVPLSIELLIGVRIPPVLVKLSVVQFGYLRKEITHCVENQVEAGQEKYQYRQHQPQHQLYPCYLVGPVNPGLDKFRVDQVQSYQQNCSHPHFLCHVEVVDALPAGVLRIDQPGSKHEQAEVRNSHIVRVIRPGLLSLLQSILIILPKIPVYCNIRVHLHEVNHSLDDDKNSVSRAPIIFEYDIGGISEESALGCMLQDSCKDRIKPFQNQHLQEVGGERPAY